MKKTYWKVSVLILFVSCSHKKGVDLIIHNTTIYTIDTAFSTAEAMAIKDGKIVGIGTNETIEDNFSAKDTLNAQGKYVYPGFIDAHTHFYRYGLSLQTANLVGTKSWEETIEKVKAFAAKSGSGWLIGRGWDQNVWADKRFPSNQKLNSLFPNRPVLLTRIDGHAAIANQRALDIAGVKAGDNLTGGEIEVKGGKLTGMLIDNAVRLVSDHIPAPSRTTMKEALLSAQQNCFEVGLTTVDDCGLDYQEVLFIDSIQSIGALKMRVYAMLSDTRRNYDFIFKRGKIKTDYLNVRSFKVYGDGALGSRGACLLRPYTDKPGWKGFLLSNPEHFDSIASLLLARGYQICTHAIGDSGNRIILRTYARHLKGKNDLRWRIEHAQVVDTNDIKLFGQFNIIPSVQPTHATSDMYWVGERLGKERAKEAYAYRHLMDQNGWLPLGTDFPIEDISPVKTFYAAVIRKDTKGFPLNGFQMEDALSRESALKGMTTWAARANFEENEKGSLEKGKFADFIILDKDLMKVAADSILYTKVSLTYVNGEKVYEKQ